MLPPGSLFRKHSLFLKGSSFYERIKCSIIILVEGGKVVLQRHPKYPQLRLPGGRIEASDKCKLEACAYREMREEHKHIRAKLSDLKYLGSPYVKMRELGDNETVLVHYFLLDLTVPVDEVLECAEPGVRCETVLVDPYDALRDYAQGNRYISATTEAGLRHYVALKTAEFSVSTPNTALMLPLLLGNQCK